MSLHELGILVEVFAFLCVLAIGLGLERILRARRERVRRALLDLNPHLAEAREYRRRRGRTPQPDRRSGAARDLPPAFRYVVRAAQQAGVPIGLQTVLVLIVGAAVGCWALAVTVTGVPWLGLLAAVAGLYAPVFYLGRRGAQRAKKAEAQFVTYLQTLAQALRGGLSIQQGLSDAAKEIEPPFGPEARHMARTAAQFGVHDAVRGLEESFRLPDLRLFAAAVRIHQETGGDLPRVLDSLVQTVRSRRETRAVLQSATAQGRMQADVLFVVPWFLLFVFRMIDPSYMAPLFDTPTGIFVFAFCVVWMVLGYIIMNRVMQQGVAE